MPGQPASKPGTKYETDYVAWTREQAEMLRSEVERFLAGIRAALAWYVR